MSGSRSRAFSLVEVAIAMGLVAFAVISLLGLMTVSLDVGKQSHEDTTVAAMAQSVLSEIRTNSYPLITNLSEERYFSFDGLPLASSNDAYYRGNIQVLSHTSPELPESARNSSSGVRVRIQFFKPPQNLQAHEIFETTIARY